jgi:HEAT repeat protein
LIRLGNSDTDGDVRAQAWFWLAQTGAAESEESIGVAIRKDTNEHVREQAIFALSQLPDERATRALVAVAQDRSLPNEQRKRAVFLARAIGVEGSAVLSRKGVGRDRERLTDAIDLHRLP